jgi:MrfA Zn-binding domain
VLQIDLNEVGVSFRRAVGGGDEIVLYDKAPGGAGLVKEARQRWIEIASETRRVVTDCACERTCYDCLKDFANQTHHRALNRHDVIEFFSSSSQP